MIREEVYSKGKDAQAAARRLAILPTSVKDRILAAMADALESRQEEILGANEKDMALAEGKKLSGALLDRLLLTPARVAEMAVGLRALVSLPDPVGEVISMWTRPNGLQVGKVRVPLGVVGIIYEARPNVTVDAAGLCMKTGNAVLLRGSSEAIHSNKAITSVIASAAEGAGAPRGSINLIETTDREAVNIMLRMNEYLDVVIPRGGQSLIQTVVKNASVPVIETGVGNCHVFVDRDADLAMAEEIVINAKTQRPGVCNAMETLLVDRQVAPAFLPALAARLNSLGVEIRACPAARPLVPGAKEATEEDWAAEYLDLILAVRVVEDFDAALDHIARYGTRHSEAIVTENYGRARKFLQYVDAAAVFVNASTRFTDGFQFGFGAEIGISTQKLHARGPMGPQELTTTKFIIFGNGQIRI